MKSRKTQYQINASCNRCKLHKETHPKAVCLRGYNSDGRRPLVVFTDRPDYFANNAHRPYSLDTRRMLDWFCDCSSIDRDSVAYEYTLRCYGGASLPTTKAGRASVIEECSSYRFAAIKRLRPRAIVVLGDVSLEAFTGKSRAGKYEGRELPCWEPVVRDICPTVWVGYSLSYILTSPSDTSRVFRVFFTAAKRAGLNPKLDPTVPPFQWRNIK